MPNPVEVAQLVVQGRQFEDWESVWVQLRWGEAFNLFKFTAAERAPLPTRWEDLQFTVGDGCTVLLAGRLAITGFITQRQTAYDATSHAVQLNGVSRTYFASTSSVGPDDKTGNFDNMAIGPIADKVLKPFGIKAKGASGRRCQCDPVRPFAMPAR